MDNDVFPKDLPAPSGAKLDMLNITRAERDNFSSHTLWTDADNDPPRAICDRNGSVTLSLCKLCHRGESELYDVACSARPASGMPDAPPSRGETFVDGVTRLRRPSSAPERNAADILEGMAETFRERNRAYGSNYKMIGPLVKVLFPGGVPPELVTTHRWHIFELKLVKLSRFAISGLTHQDSIHDDGVYSAMIEALLENGEDAS